jgi:hypothetical protein
MSRPRNRDDATYTCLYWRCPYAGKQLTAQQRASGAVRISMGFMHADCHRVHTLEVANRFRAEFRPSPALCGVCRDWTNAIYRFGFDGTPMCIACAARAGDGQAVETLRLAAGRVPRSASP